MRLREALARLREGTYEAGDHTVYYQDADTVRDAADLYAVLGERAKTGSPNMENELALSFVRQLQSGRTLTDQQLAKLLDLTKRYGKQLALYRKGSDRSQDILSVPQGDTARILS